MLIIGERINASRKPIAEAISSRDISFIQNEAKIQATAGADYLDVNAGTFVGEEAKHLRWIVETVQEVVDLPLCIDSPDPSVIKTVLPLVKKTPMINSITLEPFRLEGILPWVAEHKAKVIALCQSGDSIADTAEAKVRMAGQLVEIGNGGKYFLWIIFILIPLSILSQPMTSQRWQHWMLLKRS